MNLKGVQIVKISDDHTYEFDEKALQQMLLQDNVKDCSVVVVSIAGAYRGGKSFMLDFFLRYLYFKYINDNDDGDHANDWLGDDNEPLIGFSWRGGSARDTTGIIIWSEPIHITLPSGEKVVVLLMDTQGTFDTSSTVRDSSTIFALSTLLSSVQVYNIPQNIREDNLQHLQLFTEYGKLASSDEDRPFQKLLFLVRDWSCPYEYAYGSTGGDQLLQQILEIKAVQPQELQEIRQYISSSFDSVNCFLMPHPGLPATLDPRFKGCLAEIREEFKTSLHELVPSLLAPENLTVKLINGRPVKARDLVDYFRTYVEEFNSDHLPSPLTIMQATAKVSLLSAIDEARRQYCSKMAVICDAQAPCLPPPALTNAHKQALSAARLHLDIAPALKFVPQADRDSQLAQLMEELTHSLSHYRVLNEEKKVRNITRSKVIYEETLLVFAKLENIDNLCLHPEDLKKAHGSAKEAALSEFDLNRITPEDPDGDREELLMHFEARQDQLRNLNKTNSLRAVSDAQEFYSTCMEEHCGTQPCMNRRELELKHDEALARAINIFKAKRNFHLEYPVDTYKSLLTKDIEERYCHLLTANDENNKDAVREAVDQYEVATRALCEGSTCVHPKHLREQHDVARGDALASFRDCRTGEQAAIEDDYLRDLKQELGRCYFNLCTKNNNNNESAARVAHEEYRRGMQSISNCIFRNEEQAVTSAHQEAQEAAQRLFRSKRSGSSFADDKHQELLHREIEASYLAICVENRKKVLVAELAAAATTAAAGVASLAFGLTRLLR